MNADETLLGGALITKEENDIFKRNPEKSDYFDKIYEAKLERSLITLDVDTKELKNIYSENAWLNHIQFSPTDPDLLMYCHEGPWHKVDRIWTIDIKTKRNQLMHERTVHREIAGHEFFSPDGKNIWFDLQIPRGETFYLARRSVYSQDTSRYAMKRDEWSIHFTISPDLKTFAGDGGDEGQVAHAKDGMWLYHFTLKNDSLISEKLVNMKHHDYDLEPNVHFSPDGKWIIFRANFEGTTQIYAVEIEKTTYPMNKSVMPTFLVFLVFLICSVGPLGAQETVTPWPETSSITKPWTRWWWMGNAVDRKNIANSLVELSKAGLGGVEIQPIYGVKGEEPNYLDYLSPEWLSLLDETIAIADSLHMQVDMTLGTGWPYGGPQVKVEHAATKLIVDTLHLKKGERIKKKVWVKEEKDRASAQLIHVLAFGKNGDYIDLTPEIKEGVLNWKAKGTDFTLYKVFIGKTGQQVKRAAPGGQGFTVDHYSNAAFNAYIQPFDKAFKDHGDKLRAIFNDSYEVYQTDFTPDFFEAFEKRRGYDLKPHLNLLLDKTDKEAGNRVKSDYRETLSDLLLTQFDEAWTGWAHSKGFKTRLQAHGSPGNLIDMYASADIPECETFGSMPFDIKGFRREKEDIREGDADPVMLKFSSSAAHISGKPLTSSETFTWLRDHFKTALSQCKPEAEDLLLNGVNHIFLHGSTYSPKRAVWPGWKFYASVNFNPNNSIWQDAPALFSYLANCQSMLQAGTPDNEILLYWPVYDIWNEYLNGSLFFQFKIHSLNEWLHGTPFYKTTQSLMKKGYGVDFISDAFIEEATVANGRLVVPGGSYKSLVVPDCRNMP